MLVDLTDVSNGAERRVTYGAEHCGLTRLRSELVAERRGLTRLRTVDSLAYAVDARTHGEALLGELMLVDFDACLLT